MKVEKMDILKTKISYVPRIGEAPQPIELDQVLKAISNPVKTKALIQQIREVEHDIQTSLQSGNIDTAKALKDTHKAPMKLQLPAFIFGAVCEGGHKAEHIVSKTGIVCIDFDSDQSTTPAQWETFRDNLINVKYVFYTALSVSASGVMALLKIADPERQSEHFEQMKIDFAGLLQKFNVKGAKLDISKGGNPAQLRFITYDTDAKYEPDFKIYDRLPQQITIQKNRPHYKIDTASDVEKLIQLIQQERIDLTNDYDTWVQLAFAFVSEFGASGREYFHAISQYHPDYIEQETDKLYSDCCRSKTIPKKPATIDSFFYLAKINGILLYKSHNNPKNYRNSELIDTSTGEVFDYPPEWDEVRPPDEGTPEYAEMIRIIESEFDTELTT